MLLFLIREGPGAPTLDEAATLLLEAMAEGARDAETQLEELKAHLRRLAADGNARAQQTLDRLESARR